MNIKQKKEDTKLTVSVEGRIDSATAPTFMEFLQGALTGITELVLDCEKLEYISSAGLRVILFAQKTMNKQGSMVVCNVNSDIMETFELTSFTDILTIR